ncbi:MAG: hypothetical protein ABEJ78_01390 [Haloferacaceae archaeon]
MVDQSAKRASDDGGISAGEESSSPRMAVVLGLAVGSAVLFALGLELTEFFGEFALDVDFKPFFIPYLLISFVRFRISTLAIGTGAALGEGALDVSEGYELEDPLGFVGYVIGFMAFGWYLRDVADDPASGRAQTIAATLGAFVQATSEGLAFFLFETEAGLLDGVTSVLGNTVTHGLVLGAVPLVVLYSYLHGRVGTLDVSEE